MINLIKRLYHNKKIVVLATLLCTTIVLILCLIPSSKLQNIDSPISDKWAHFLAFATMSFLWLCVPKQVKARHYVLVVIRGFLFGWIIELLQISPLTYGRSFEVNDIIADGIGAIIGAFIFFLFRKLFIQPSPSHPQQ